MSEHDAKDVIQGVGVLRYPEWEFADDQGGTIQGRELARELAENIRKGSVLILPNTRDENGHYVWDFRIEGGDPGQVEVRRTGDQEADTPQVVQRTA